MPIKRRTAHTRLLGQLVDRKRAVEMTSHVPNSGGQARRVERRLICLKQQRPSGGLEKVKKKLRDVEIQKIVSARMLVPRKQREHLETRLQQWGIFDVSVSRADRVIALWISTG